MAKKLMMNIEDIKTESPFKDIFTINPADLLAIKKDMKSDDYDLAHPIVIWEETSILLDGHTRLQAAIDSGYEEIPVVKYSFESESDAIEYAIHSQMARRNISEYDLLMLVQRVDKLSEGWGGDRTKISSFGNQILESREVTAKLLNISKDKVSVCRRILKSDHPENIEAIKNGEITLHRAYQNPPRKQLNTDIKENKKKKEIAIAKRIDPAPINKAMAKWRHITPDESPHKKIGAKKNFYHSELIYLSTHLIRPLLDKSAVMSDLADKLYFFKDRKQLFEGVTEQEYIQEFLTSPFVTKFIDILKMFDFDVEYPEGAKNWKTKLPEPSLVNQADGEGLKVYKPSED
ncbi:MAG: hypothetical protein C0399_05760 [Syntrophus sp. (in: bacteria)]|nr:hypothetical protein [Syntrophus sp. (in: bacteria)]